ncbi:MAG: hypothetical protein Q9182_000653 [Xanthomendoza sp. 2 TL-2023]
MADYHMLACMIAKHGEAAIFRRFDVLNIKNLLYKKAELVHLEAELRQIEKEEKLSTDLSKSAYPFSVYELQQAARSGNGTQWIKYQEIQSKLEAYSMAIQTRLSSADLKFRNKIVHCSNTTLFARSQDQRRKPSKSFGNGSIALKGETFSSDPRKPRCGTSRMIYSICMVDYQMTIG